jgi:hypothetical protein
MGLIDQTYADYSSQVPARQVRAVMRAPNAPKAIEAIIKGEPSQVATLLRLVDGMPGPEKAKALTALKKATGQWVHDRASLEKGYVQQLNAYGHALSQIPDVAFNRFYGPGAKSQMQHAVRATIEFHQKMLAHGYRTEPQGHCRGVPCNAVLRLAIKARSSTSVSRRLRSLATHSRIVTREPAPILPSVASG